MAATRKMSQDHKDAMAVGRRESRAVKNYLRALERGRKRGPKVTPEKLRDRIEQAGTAIDDEPNPVKRLELIQGRMNNQQRLAAFEDEVAMEDLQAEFVVVAA